jgi:hypothetical protein
MWYADSAYVIKGTRIFVAAYMQETSFYHGPPGKFKRVRWFIKDQGRRYFTEINFLEVLEKYGKDIKPDYRAELLFYLDLFT